jgi:hypothetical protein
LNRTVPNFAASLLVVPLLAAGAAVSLWGCSEKPATVAPVDSVSAERVEALEKEFRAIKEERDSLLHGASVSSSEAMALASKLKEMQDRLVELEARQAATSASAPGTTAAGGSAPGGPATPIPPVVGIPIPPDTTTPFSEEQLGAFRRMSDEVDRRKMLEQQAKRLKDDLTRAGVTLTPDQEAAVLKIQQGYTDKMRELYRNGGGATDADRQTLVAKRDELRNEYANEIRAAVPAAEADKIVEATNRMGGFRPRQGGPNGMGGMGGN